MDLQVPGGRLQLQLQLIFYHHRKEKDPEGYRVQAAEDAIAAKESGVYNVRDSVTGNTVNCASVIMFQATTDKKPTHQDLPATWYAATKRLTLKNNITYSWGESYTAYYW